MGGAFRSGLVIMISSPFCLLLHAEAHIPKTAGTKTYYKVGEKSHFVEIRASCRNGVFQYYSDSGKILDSTNYPASPLR